jgi:hypothetical protein
MVNCGEGMKKRYRKCLNPPTINNALGCEGFPMQIQTCFVACQTYVWSEWSAWQIECDNEDTCKKIRKRFCIGSEASKCVGESTETVNCSSKAMCFEQNPVSTRLNEIDSIFAGWLNVLQEAANFLPFIFQILFYYRFIDWQILIANHTGYCYPIYAAHLAGSVYLHQK